MTATSEASMRNAGTGHETAAANLAWMGRRKLLTCVGGLFVIVAMGSACGGEPVSGTPQAKTVALSSPSPIPSPDVVVTSAAPPPPAVVPTTAAPVVTKQAQVVPPPKPKPVVTQAPVKTAAPKPVAPVAAAEAYSNCAEMNQDYPHGVGQPGAADHTSGTPVTNFYVSRTIYEANTARDRDKDGIACEHA